MPLVQLRQTPISPRDPNRSQELVLCCKQLSCCRPCWHPVLEFEPSQLLLLQSGFLPMLLQGKRRSQYLDSVFHVGYQGSITDIWLCYGPALATGHCGYLGNEPANGNMFLRSKMAKKEKDVLILEPWEEKERKFSHGRLEKCLQNWKFYRKRKDTMELCRQCQHSSIKQRHHPTPTARDWSRCSLLGVR